MKMIDQNIERNSWLQMQMMNMNDMRLRENAAEWCPSSEVKEERKVQVEEWTTRSNYVRVDNHVKTHDSNEEGNN